MNKYFLSQISRKGALIALFLALLAQSCIRAEDYQWPIKTISGTENCRLQTVRAVNTGFLVSSNLRSCFHYESSNGKVLVNNAAAGRQWWTGSKYIRYYLGDIYESLDRKTWVLLGTSNINLSGKSVVWDGSRFVAADKRGGIYTSPDALIWTWVHNTGKFQGRLYFAQNKYFLKYIDRNQHYWSSDLIQWQKIILPDVNALVIQQKIVYGNSVFVMAAIPQSFYSNDGVNWMIIEPKARMDSVTWCDSSYGFVGISSTDRIAPETFIYTSLDGVKWEEHVNTFDARRHHFHDIDCIGERYLAVGNTAYGVSVEAYMYSP